MSQPLRPEDADADTANRATCKEIAEWVAEYRRISGKYGALHGFDRHDPRVPAVREEVSRLDKLRNWINATQLPLLLEITALDGSTLFRLEKKDNPDLDPFEKWRYDFDDLRRRCVIQLGARHESDIVLLRDGLPLPRTGEVRTAEQTLHLYWHSGDNRFYLSRLGMMQLDTQKLHAVHVPSHELADTLRRWSFDKWWEEIKLSLLVGDVDLIRRLWLVVRPEDHKHVRQELSEGIRTFKHKFRIPRGGYGKDIKEMENVIVEVCGLNI